MLEGLSEFLRNSEVALLFLILGLGFLLGKAKVGGLDVGSVSGVLFVGLFFGHFGFSISPAVQSIGFAVFIFSVGHQAGPQFFDVLFRDGLRYLALALVIAGTAFALSLGLGKTMDFEFGITAGLLAGGLTSSPTLAAAQEAVGLGQIAIPAGTTADQVMTNITTGYAITYVFGLAGLILIVRLLPRLVGIDLAKETARLAAEHTGAAADEALGVKDLQVRAYRVEENRLVGIPVSELEARIPGQAKLAKLRRGGDFLSIGPETTLEIGDEVAIVGYLERFLEGAQELGPELSDPGLLDVPLESARIVVLRRKVRKERTVRPSSATTRFGCFVSRLERLGIDLPLGDEVAIRSGDVVHVTGHRASIERLAAQLGHLERSVAETDLLTFGLGIALGALLGSLAVELGGISIGLGAAGGLLTTGLLIGYLRSIHPTFGRVPEAARWAFMELGLLMFMASVGLRAGSGILETLQTTGASLVLCGVVVTSVPVAVGFFFGRKVLAIHPVLLLGAIAGSMTSGASLSIVVREAGSSLPSLGYTGAYAFANVFLTIAGSIILLF